jgi:hypothetical protein
LLQVVIVVGHTAQEVRRVSIIGAPAAVEEIAINFQPVCALYADLSVTLKLYIRVALAQLSHAPPKDARTAASGGLARVVSPQQVNVVSRVRTPINLHAVKRVAHVQPTTAAPKTHHVAQVEGTGIEAELIKISSELQDTSFVAHVQLSPPILGRLH